MHYVNFLMSTENPCNPDDGNWVKPNIHPCKKYVKDIEKQKWDKDYDDLVNSVQRHTHVQLLIAFAKNMKTITPADFTILKIAVIKLTWSMRKFIRRMANCITELKWLQNEMTIASTIISVYSYKDGEQIVIFRLLLIITRA